MQPLINFIKNPRIFVQSLLNRFGVMLPDRIYLKWMFRLRMGKKLNLDNPISYNEKLQWLKLYDRRPEYTMMVDKYAVKDYVTQKIGKEYVIPTLGVWNSIEEIEWEKLPNQFVLKTTHDGGSCGVVICQDKSVFDRQKAIVKLKRSLSYNPYNGAREWPYKNVPKRIIAEKYIEPDPDLNDLPDYKYFCFNGEVKALFVATDRQTPGEEVKFDFFDADYNHLPFRQGHNNATIVPDKPGSFDKMKQLASKLSEGIPQLRVDFYEVNGRPLFGEMTFFHFSGMVPFCPQEWDDKFGGWIRLPKK